MKGFKVQKEIEIESPVKWTKNTQLRKDHQNRKLQKGGGGGFSRPRPPFVVAAERRSYSSVVFS